MQQSLKDVFFPDLARNFIGRPAIGVPDGAVEEGVGVAEPDGTLVVKAGEGSFS